jgi:hypothetical protein
VNGLVVELHGMAALQWALTSPLRGRNTRIARYMSDVEAWARHQAQRSMAGCPQYQDAIHVQLGCQGIAKLLYFIHQGRMIVFWLHEFFREEANEDDGKVTLH